MNNTKEEKYKKIKFENETAEIIQIKIDSKQKEDKITEERPLQNTSLSVIDKVKAGLLAIGNMIGEIVKGVYSFILKTFKREEAVENV